MLIAVKLVKLVNTFRFVYSASYKQIGVVYFYKSMKLDITEFTPIPVLVQKNSTSDTDFSSELPRSFNVPDGVVAHIDDIVIPV